MYALVRLVIGSKKEIEISEMDYDQASSSRHILGQALFVEKNFHIICELYKEIEMHYFSQTMESLLYNLNTPQDFYSIGASYAPKLLAALSAIKLYRDSVCSHVGALSGGKIKKDTIEDLFRSQYDKSFNYRFMEAVRNYSQHRAFPIHGVSLHSRWEAENLKFSTKYYFDKNEIVEADKFKASVLAEINDLSDKIDIRKCFNAYFAQLCEIHGQIRELINPHVSLSENIIEDLRKRWQGDSLERDVVGVVACKLDGGLLDNSIKPIYLKSSGDDDRNFLRFRTFSFANMAKRTIEI